MGVHLPVALEGALKLKAGTYGIDKGGGKVFTYYT
jgi:glucosamine 6-phosphate synthetase-like amidotransferase/phosphosugar isomerase protein